MMEDKIYVVYFDDKMYRGNSRKSAYLEPKFAKQVISEDSKRLAENMYAEENKPFSYWFEVPKDKQEEYISRARARFEIREFTEKGAS